jgi:hypothetical protein
MKIALIALMALLATPALAGDEVWRSNGEADVWVTTRNGVEISFECDGSDANPRFSVIVKNVRTNVRLPSYMGLSAYAGTTNLSQSLFRTQSRIEEYDFSSSGLTARGLQMNPWRGEGGDAIRAISRAESVVIGVRETSGEWEGIRVGTRGAREAFQNSWCNEATYRRWRAAYN